MNELAKLEKLYSELVLIHNEYIKAFAWLYEQDWFKNKSHLLHEFIQEERIYEIKKELKTGAKKRVTVTCSYCGDEIAGRSRITKVVECNACKMKRKAEAAKKQQR